VAHILNAFEVTLNDGESWDDELTLVMTREQANILLAAMTMQMQQVSEGLDAARHSATRGDLTAIFAEPALRQSATQLQTVLKIVARTCDPVAYEAIMTAHVMSDEVGNGE